MSNPTEDGSRATTVLPCGHEVLDVNQVHYCEYIALEALLQLQEPFAGSARERDIGHHDERQFIVVHQVCELIFSQIIFELHTAIERLQDRDFLCAVARIDRATHWVKLASHVTKLLDTMTPVDFYMFRASLFPASGAESEAFRKIEVLAGMQAYSPYMATEHGTYTYRQSLDRVLGGGAHDMKSRWWTIEIERLIGQPSIATVFAGLLQHVPLSVIYTEDRFLSLRTLADALYRFEIAFLGLRTAHVKVTERQIGEDKGGANTMGVKYLKAVAATARFFPALWDYKQRAAVAPPTP